MKSTATYRTTGNQAYWPLPSIPAQETAQSSLKEQLSSLGRKLLTLLTTTAEPRVWQSHDTAGNVLWNAYDSASDRIIRNASESELRTWLETRYQF